MCIATSGHDTRQHHEEMRHVQAMVYISNYYLGVASVHGPNPLPDFGQVKYRESWQTGSATFPGTPDKTGALIYYCINSKGIQDSH